MFYKKPVTNSFKKFTGKRICKSLFLNKMVDLLPTNFKKSPVQAFSCESCQIFHGKFFAEHLWATASNKGRQTFDVHDNCQIFKTPYPPFPATSKVLPAPWPWTPNFEPDPPSSANDSLSIKRKHNPRMTIISYQVFPSGRFLFSVSAH